MSLMKDVAENVMNRPADRGGKIWWTLSMTRGAANSRFLDRDDLERIAAPSEVKRIVGPAVGPAIVFRVRDVEGDTDFGNGIVSIAIDSQGIAERVFAIRPALVVNCQLVTDVRLIDHAVIEVLDAVRVEREFIIRIRRLAGVEIMAQEIADLRLGHIAGILRSSRDGRPDRARLAQGRVALKDWKIRKIAGAFGRRRGFADSKRVKGYLIRDAGLREAPPLLITLERHRVFRALAAIDIAKKQMALPQFLLHLARLFVRERASKARQRAKQQKDERFFLHNYRFAAAGNDGFKRLLHSNSSAAIA